MPSRQPTPQSIASPDTPTLLTQAAMAEFCEHGYNGTDSNKIARRAGFAPQTFYRWFKDKPTVFIAAYRAWEEQELALLDTLAAKKQPAHKMAEAVIQHHRDHLLFRRSLRQLAVDVPEIRQARTASRERQLKRILTWSGATERDTILLGLFQVERLADAVAEGELADLNVSETHARDTIAAIIDQARQK